MDCGVACVTFTLHAAAALAWPGSSKAAALQGPLSCSGARCQEARPSADAKQQQVLQQCS